MPAHQSASSWSAGWGDVIVRQSHRVAVQSIERRRLYDWVAEGRDVTVALVISDDQYHVGGVRRRDVS